MCEEFFCSRQEGGAQTGVKQRIKEALSVFRRGFDQNIQIEGGAGYTIEMAAMPPMMT